MGVSTIYRRSVHRSAYAKVNLCLSVGPPREEDGLHPIASWMARIALADDLLVTRLEEDRLSRYAILWHRDALQTSPIDWSITKDLAVRAHLLLEKEVDRSLPVQLKLEKRIPVGGGLGGGSADAASMLLAVRDLFELEISDERLRELALELGSDVPFFLGADAAIVEGVGDQLEETPAPNGSLVLILPRFSCATGAVYRAFDDDPGEGLRADAVRELARGGRVEVDALFNDLAGPAERVEPSLAALRKKIAEVIDKPVHITGSGSTMFIVCPEGADEAMRIARELNESDLSSSECVVHTTRFVEEEATSD